MYLMATFLIQLVTRGLLLHKVSTKRLPLPQQLSWHSWYCFNKANQTVLTLVWVFGLWQLIMLTMKCYDYKIRPQVIFTNVGCGRWWNVPNRNFYNPITRYLHQQGSPQQKIKRWYCSMLWDLILEIPSFIFHLSWCTIRKQAFPIKSWQKVLKSPRLKGGAMKISSGAGNFMVELKSYKGGAAPF